LNPRLPNKLVAAALRLQADSFAFGTHDYAMTASAFVGSAPNSTGGRHDFLVVS
jgi:hypothetical protein